MYKLKIIYRILILISAAAALVLSVFWLTKATYSWNWASALAANWFVAVWFASLTLLVPLRIPERYYNTGDFEKTGRIYEMLGVVFFLRLIRRGPLHILAPDFEYGGKREYLPELEQYTRSSEAIHVYAFSTSLLLTAFALYNGWFISAAWLLASNIPLNVYPVMLQRYNRLRLQKMIVPSRS